MELRSERFFVKPIASRNGVGLPDGRQLRLAGIAGTKRSGSIAKRRQVQEGPEISIHCRGRKFAIELANRLAIDFKIDSNTRRTVLNGDQQVSIF